MSLDSTSHAVMPSLDELVPSRYALKVGEIDVMVVSDGVLTLPGAMLGHNADPAVRAAWLKDMFLFEHDPGEAARVRVGLLRELVANRESLVATHLSFPSVCHVAVAGDVFRWVPGLWEY